MLVSNDELSLGHPLLHSIEAAHHAISGLNDANLSVHHLATECFLVISMQRARDAAGVIPRASPSLSTVEAAEACSKLVAFESQLPSCSPMPAPSQDPMLFEAQVPPPKKIPPLASPRPLTTTTTPLKTYRRWPCSDAARPPASAALQHLAPDVGSSPPIASREVQAREEAHPCRDETVPRRSPNSYQALPPAHRSRPH
jgi:hypothetical protein